MSSVDAFSPATATGRVWASQLSVDPRRSSDSKCASETVAHRVGARLGPVVEQHTYLNA